MLGRIETSGWVLIIGNIITIITALAYSTPILTIMWAYWFESIFIGVFTVFAIFASLIRSRDLRFVAISLFMMVFFCFHYGGFHASYAIFLSIFSSLFGTGTPFIPLGIFSGVINAFFGEKILSGETVFTPDFIIFAVTLFIVHLYSFVQNKLKNPPQELTLETGLQTIGKDFWGPYTRIIPMHVTIILAGFVLAFAPANFNVVLLFVFMGIKLFVDLRAHQKEHGFLPSKPSQSGL